MERLAGVTMRHLRRVFRSLNGSFAFYVDLLCLYERRVRRFLTAYHTLGKGHQKQAVSADSRLGQLIPAAAIPHILGRGRG
jgi:hypothetical protein